MAGKPITKELSTFLSWEKENVIGYTEETINSKQYVTKIWCKICAKHKNEILNSTLLKGAATKSIKAFTEGTNVVTKHQVIIRYLMKTIWFISKWKNVQGQTMG